jgi:hypothetical protein
VLSGSREAEATLLEKTAHADKQRWTWDALAGRTLHGRVLAKRGDREGAKRELLESLKLALELENRVVVQDCTDALADLE